MDLDKQITALAEAREEVANYNRSLAERELESRVLRTRLTLEARQGVRTPDGKDWAVAPVSSNDAAEKCAKVHPDYLAYERETAGLVYQRDLSLAIAESRAFALKAALTLGSLTT